MWEEEYLKISEPVRTFSLERDGIQDDEGDSDESEDDSPFTQIPFCDESPRAASIREQAHAKAWQACERDIRDVLRNLYQGTINDIKTFVQRAPTSARFGQRQLPTGLILGANQTLSSALVEDLRRHLEAADEHEAGPSTAPQDTLVARIWSRDCLNKRMALKTITNAVIACSESHQQGNVQKRPPGKKLSVLASDDVDVLTAWYEAKFGTKDTRPKIVLSLEEVETFDSATLSDLLYSLSVLAKTLPILLLLGVSTSIDAIHNLLPRASSELLRISTFTVTANVETFHSLMTETFIKRRQVISPSAKVFAFLRDSFLDLDQSIDGVISKIKYMYLAHFFGNPASVWCVPLESLALDADAQDNITDELLQHTKSSLRSTPSYQKAMEKNTEEALRGSAAARRATSHLLKQDAGLLGHVKGARREREMYAERVPEAWTLFEVLQTTWAEGRLSIEDMLSGYFAGTLASRACTACSNLRNARDDVVLSFLRRLQQDFSSARNIAANLNLDQRLSDLEDLVRDGEKQEGMTRFVNGNIQGSIAKSSGDKLFTKFVLELSRELENCFKTHLKSFSELTFHELWYPDVHKLLRSTFHPQTVEQLHASLTAPESRLPQHLFRDMADLPTANNFDICRAHELVAEAGKLVNLSDWYGAFEVALEGENVEAEEADDGHDHRKSKRRKGAVSGPQRRSDRKGKSRATANGDGDHTDGAAPEVQDQASEDEETAGPRRREARFLAAAADLAYIGFIQPTKRKAEHVQRIVF